MFIRIRKSYRFEYSHRIFNQKKTTSNPDTKCRNWHGHSGKVTVEFSGTELNDEGMLIDFNDLKPIKDFIKMFDHRMIISSHDTEGIKMIFSHEEYKDPWEPCKVTIMGAFTFDDSASVVIVSGGSSSEELAILMADVIEQQLKIIKRNLGVKNDFRLHALEFSETDNNMVRVEL